MYIFQVENLDGLLDTQLNFLCAIFDGAFLDNDKLKLAEAINDLIVLFGSFGNNELVSQNIYFN